MTEKRFTYHELVNGQFSVDDTTYEEIYGETNTFYHRLADVNSEKQAKKVCDLLNTQHETITKQTEKIATLNDTIEEKDYNIDQYQEKIQKTLQKQYNLIKNNNILNELITESELLLVEIIAKELGVDLE